MQSPIQNQPLEQQFVDQLQRGFATLRFESSLEGPFRDFYQRFCLTHVRFGLGFAVALIPIAAWLNHYVFAIHGVAAEAFMVLAGLCTWVPMLLLFLHFLRDREGKHLPVIMACYLLSLAAALFMERVLFERAGVHHPYMTEAFGAMLIFLLSGLRMRVATLVMLVWLGQLVVFDLRYPAEISKVAERSFTVLCVTVLAFAAGYTHEYLARTNFLLTNLSRYRAEHDPLTGVLNRRGFEHRMDALLRQSRRDRTPFAMMLLDVDFFKKFNDHYGHPQGDMALSAVADTLKRESSRRAFDCAARIGGEEFVIVWFNAGPTAALALAEAVRARVEILGIQHVTSPLQQLTISGGCLSVIADQDTKLTHLLKAADDALYQSKNLGRNRITMASVKPVT